MDDATLGRLTREKKEAEQQLASLTSELRNTGAQFEALGRQLMNDPGRVVFSNAPDNLGSSPYAMGKATATWDVVGDMRKVAQKVQQIHALDLKLRNLRNQLGD